MKFQRIGAAAGLILLMLAMPLYAAPSVEQLLAGSASPSNRDAAVGKGDVQAVITPAATHALAGQEIPVTARFSIAPGWHLYGRPVPSEFTPTTVQFAPGLVASQSFAFPKPMMMKSMGESYPVYQGTFTVPGKIRIKPGLKPGSYSLTGDVQFQECNNNICRLPQSLAFAIPFVVEKSN